MRSGQNNTCQAVLQVTSKDKRTEDYYLEGSVATELHRYLCKGPKEGVLLTGSVREKDGRNGFPENCWPARLTLSATLSANSG